MLMLHHPLLPLVLTLSASDLIVWHIPLCSPGPLSAPFSPPLSYFGKWFSQHGCLLRHAAFLPCIMSPSQGRNSTENTSLPLSIIAVESSDGIQLLCLSTNGDVAEIGSLEQADTMDLGSSPESSLLLVVPASYFMMPSSSYFVIRISSNLQCYNVSLFMIFALGLHFSILQDCR